MSEASKPQVATYVILVIFIFSQFIASRVKSKSRELALGLQCLNPNTPAPGQ